MTDTPRTQAELLTTVFQDGQIGAISAQDMRDFVVSLSQPVEGGSLGSPLRERLGYLAINQPAGYVTLPAASDTSHNGDVVLIPLNAASPYVVYSPDPGGWFDNAFALSASAPESAWGLEIAAGDVAMLPTGMYDFSAFMYVGSVAADLGDLPIRCEFDQQTYDPDFVNPADTSVPWIYDGYFGPVLWNYQAVQTPNGTIVSTVTSGRVINDTPDPKPFALMGYTHGHASPVVVTYIQVHIQKVA